MQLSFELETKNILVCAYCKNITAQQSLRAMYAMVVAIERADKSAIEYTETQLTEILLTSINVPFEIILNPYVVEKLQHNIDKYIYIDIHNKAVDINIFNRTTDVTSQEVISVNGCLECMRFGEIHEFYSCIMRALPHQVAICDKYNQYYCHSAV